MIDRFNRNLVAQVAFVAAAAAGSATLSGCGISGPGSSRHEAPVVVESGLQSATPGALQEDYTALGVSVDPTDSTRYALQNVPDKSRGRYTMVADVAPTAAAVGPVLFSPDPAIEQEYGVGGAFAFRPTWQIKVGPADSAQKTFLPIATEEVDTKGGLVVTDQRPPQARTNPASNQTYDTLLSSVVVPEAAYVRAAIDAGAVSKVHFVYNPDNYNDELKDGIESPEFNEITHEVTIVIARRTPTPVQQLIATQTHEITHGAFGLTALSENTPQADTSAKATALRNGCLAIKAVMLKQARASIPGLIPYYQNVEALIPGHTTDINYIITQIQAGKIANLQYSSKDPDADPNDIDECAITTPNQMMGFVRSEVLHSAPNDTAAHYTDEQKAAVNALNQAFADSIRQTQILSDISEHGYQNDPRSGHPEVSVDELAASLVDIAVNYPDEFKEYLGYLDPKARAAVQTSYGAIRTAILENTPQMSSFVPNIFAQ
ncbi:MAG: hypothetical protein JWM81_94 [Candidatus Saccharibacteria bacterium]|nr:hypothetical protein [Candidatus Saccharibacteria bacterium]